MEILEGLGWWLSHESEELQWQFSVTDVRRFVNRGASSILVWVLEGLQGSGGGCPGLLEQQVIRSCREGSGGKVIPLVKSELRGLV